MASLTVLLAGWPGVSGAQAGVAVTQALRAGLNLVTLPDGSPTTGIGTASSLAAAIGETRVTFIARLAANQPVRWEVYLPSLGTADFLLQQATPQQRRDGNGEVYLVAMKQATTLRLVAEQTPNRVAIAAFNGPGTDGAGALTLGLVEPATGSIDHQFYVTNSFPAGVTEVSISPDAAALVYAKPTGVTTPVAGTFPVLRQLADNSEFSLATPPAPGDAVFVRGLAFRDATSVFWAQERPVGGGARAYDTFRFEAYASPATTASFVGLPTAGARNQLRVVGTHLFYGSNESIPTSPLHLMELTGTGPVQLSQLPLHSFGIHPDSTAAVLTTTSTATQLFNVDLEGSSVSFLLSASSTLTAIREPIFAGDASVIFFLARNGSNAEELYSVSPDGGTPRRVTTGLATALPGRLTNLTPVYRP